MQKMFRVDLLVVLSMSMLVLLPFSITLIILGKISVGILLFFWSSTIVIFGFGVLMHLKKEKNIMCTYWGYRAAQTILIINPFVIWYFGYPPWFNMIITWGMFFYTTEKYASLLKDKMLSLD